MNGQNDKLVHIECYLLAQEYLLTFNVLEYVYVLKMSLVVRENTIIFLEFEYNRCC